MTKRALSISLGSSSRDKSSEIELAGGRIALERVGTDGDVARARHLFAEWDGRVDAFGLGGMDLGFWVNHRWYRLHDAERIVREVCQTPVVDGAGLKITLESHLAQVVENRLGDRVRPKRVLITAGTDRYGMAVSFERAGYECVYADLMFALGLPIAIRGLENLHRLARILMPVVGRLPLSWLYPVGKQQEQIVPKWERWYQWATVIAGDFLYIKRHLPERIEGKIIATNTTTEQDQELLRQRGADSLITSTPMIDGRSFGTNVLEAALVARAGAGRRLTVAELSGWVDQLHLEPQILMLQEPRPGVA